MRSDVIRNADTRAPRTSRAGPVCINENISIKLCDSRINETATPDNMSEGYQHKIQTEKDNVLSTTEGLLDTKQWTRKEGKVRDSYLSSDKVLLVTTDRVSAFDRHLASIPFKGQVMILV